jgi:uncharacterized membrane protein
MPREPLDVPKDATRPTDSDASLSAHIARARGCDTVAGGLLRRLRTLAGPFFVFAGAMHFIAPRPYRAIMPRWIPAPDAMVALSGVAEIAGGAGLMTPHGATRRWAGWWLVATLVAIFPANLEMALHPERYSKVPGGRAALWARLPLQALFIGWVLGAAQEKERRP